MKGNSKSALVAVLDWGLGHATRSVPVIRELQKQNVRVTLGGNGLSLRFLQTEFPELPFHELPSYGVFYPKKGSMIFPMIVQWPRIKKAIRQERKRMEEIVQREKIDFILSDNRYGCYSAQVKSVFIGHQLNLQMPSGLSILSRFLNRLHLKMIGRFHQVWIPDQETGFRFSGNLSDCSLAKCRRVGILSRFSGIPSPGGEPYEIVALVSGPEPQRTVFENLLRVQLQKLNRKSLMVKGRPGIHDQASNGLITEINHLNSKALESVLISAGMIVARSGYSTIMDLAVLGKKVILIPTPGQTEQEYLAQYLMSNKMTCALAQNQFDLEIALAQSASFNPLPKTEPNSLLATAIRELTED